MCDANLVPKLVQKPFGHTRALRRFNCQYTVGQGGKSTGNCRHEQLARITYKIASTIARRGCFSSQAAQSGTSSSSVITDPTPWRGTKFKTFAFSG